MFRAPVVGYRELLDGPRRGPIVTSARHRLVQRREELGLTQEDVANALGANTKTVARYERGESTPRPGQRPRLARILQWSTAQLALALTDGEAAGAPNGQAVLSRLSWYANLEQGASAIEAFQPFTVHALLQTTDYATAVERVGPEPVPEDEVAQLVGVRMSRQAALDREPEPLHLSVVLDESVLFRTTGSGEIMAYQLEHLAQVAQRSNVEVRLLPLDAGVHSAAFGSFTLLNFGGSTKRMVCVEDRTGFRYLDRPYEVEAHAALFAHLCDYSIPPSESANVILRIAKERYS
jgi:transcriptional regulator with XRE-family HTH domain